MNFGSAAIKLNSVKSYNVKVNNSNNVFKNKFYSDSKIDSDNYYKYEDIDYNKINLEESIEKAKSLDQEEWYESAFNVLKTIRDYGVTFQTSLTFGVLELVENVGDALIMAGGAVASGVVSIWDEDKALEIKEGTGNVVAYDWTEALYDKAIKFQGVDQDIAHSWVHTAGSMVGTTAAYIALSCVPGGAAVTATVGAVTAVGSASEMALNSGANFDQAFTCGAVAGVIGAASGGALNKVQTLAGGAKSVVQVSGYTALGSAVAVTEPVINTTSQYLIYGKDIKDENGKQIYDGYFDYYNKSGGLLQTSIAAVVGGVSTGAKATQGYRKYKIEFDNYVNNNSIEVLEAIPDQSLRKKIYSRMPDNLNDVEKAKYIYNKLNEEMAYSTEFYYYQKDPQIQSKWRNLHVDLDNVQSREIICTNWSEMYCELLQEQGISAKVMGNGHKWCVFELNDGSKWLADATQPYNGSYDLVNAKTGVRSGGFIPITEEMFNDNTLAEGVQNMTKLSLYARTFDSSSIDNNLGYNYESIEELFAGAKTTYDSILKINENATDGQLLAQKLEQVMFSQMENLDYMEGTSYFMRMKNTLSSVDKSNIKVNLLFDGNNKPYTTFSIDLQNGTTAEYIYGGKGNMTRDIVENLG